METITVNLDFIVGRTAEVVYYDGETDDLLSGGAGLGGLQSKQVPDFKDPLNPSSAELRKRAIWNNYRALLDMSGHYYGKYYGPGVNRSGRELIEGVEYSAFLEGNVSILLQIPATFNPENPYLIAAPSSGSRGVYGAIGPVGEWALKRGFAVVYTDKGTGIGYHDLDSDRVVLRNGKTETREKAGKNAIFSSVRNNSTIEEKTIEDFRKAYPHRLAVKHTHSGVNIQKHWGEFVIKSIEFAVYILNRKYDQKFHDTDKKKITIIAAGVSNGGGASLMAAEQDKEQLIDAVVVSEPNITPVYNPEFSIVQGKNTPVTNHSKSLADYITLLNLYLPAVMLLEQLKNAPLNFSGNLTRKQCVNRTLSLKQKGLLKGKTIQEMAAESLEIIRSAGMTDEQIDLLPSHYHLDIIQSIACTYVSQYGAFTIGEHLCGYSFAAVDKKGRPVPLTKEELNCLYSDQSGIPPYGSIALINDLSLNGPVSDRLSISVSTGKNDLNIDGALKLRRLVTGIDQTNKLLTGQELEEHKRVQKGIEEIKVTTDTGQRPVIIVTGRADAVLQINHTSRAYAGARLSSGKGADLFSYYEVTNAHHLDTLNSFYCDKKYCRKPLHFAPLHYYYLQSLDIIIDYFEKSINIPESQLIRPGEPLKDLPSIKNKPDDNDRIIFSNGVLHIPD